MKENADSGDFGREFRLNYMKNFNHFNKDQEGGMEVFGKRVNNEIIRINKEDLFPEEIDTEDQTELPEYDENELSYPEEDDQEGLVINNGDTLSSISRYAGHSYPYGFSTQPNPTFQDDTGLRGPGNRQVFTFEKFKNNILERE